MRRFESAWALLLLSAALAAQPASSFLVEAMAADLVVSGSVNSLEVGEGGVAFLPLRVDVAHRGDAPTDGVWLLEDRRVLHRPRLVPGQRQVMLLKRAERVPGLEPMVAARPNLFIVTSVLPGDVVLERAVARSLALPAAAVERSTALAELVAMAPEPLAERLVIDLANSARQAPPSRESIARLRGRVGVLPPGGKLFFVLGPMLAWLGDDAVMDVMLDVLEGAGGPLAAVSVRAAFTNAEMTGERRARLHVLFRDGDMPHRSAVMGILTAHAGVEDRELVLAATADADGGVRRLAAMTLGQLRDPGDAARLEAMTTDRDREVRRAALGALARLAAWDTLRRIEADDANPDTRRLAARALQNPALLPR